MGSGISNNYQKNNAENKRKIVYLKNDCSNTEKPPGIKGKTKKFKFCDIKFK
jgi:hypothetical protein